MLIRHRGWPVTNPPLIAEQTRATELPSESSGCHGAGTADPGLDHGMRHFTHGPDNGPAPPDSGRGSRKSSAR